MKFLADENFPLASVVYLRKLGIDVRFIGTDDPSTADRNVVSMAIKEQRTLLTFDRDYGELIFKYKYRPPQGIIYLRLEEFTPEEPGSLIADLIARPELVFDYTLTVLDRNRLRQRKY